MSVNIPSEALTPYQCGTKHSLHLPQILGITNGYPVGGWSPTLLVWGSWNERNNKRGKRVRFPLLYVISMFAMHVVNNDIATVYSLYYLFTNLVEYYLFVLNKIYMIFILYLILHLLLLWNGVFISIIPTPLQQWIFVEDLPMFLFQFSLDNVCSRYRFVYLYAYFL